ncbi:ER membrane glycoprotein subunit of the GPI transamidase complex-like protein [Coemansia sp. RSA 1722]|nr:ER membrane glycoprotein subunit of the GPI transamidase complex-like protein [Coemansia sp. RSA 485]KAJ2595559.1 ER membrane glycoprotein subunit of the GPI transamidase complex-like protein [Coemansia sp. RSA 1722]
MSLSKRVSASVSRAASAHVEDRIWSVVKYAVLSRVISLALGAVSNAFVEDYDSSLSVFLPSVDEAKASVAFLSLERLARALAQIVVRWDAFYFVHIADAGYIYEQEHAFFPLLPLLMRALTSTVLSPLVSAIGRQLALVVAGVLVSNTAFVLAAVTLYRLGCRSLSNEKLAYVSALMFVVAPSNMFMSAVYTESLFAWLAFSALLLVSYEQYMLAALCLGASTLCRSNGITYAGFFVWNLLVRQEAWAEFAGDRGMRRWWAKIGTLLSRVLYSLILVALSSLGFVAFEIFGRRKLCEIPAGASEPERRLYCSDSLSTVYGFVQSKYWDVGFLRYYTLQQAPNFLLAAPMIVLSVAGLWVYAAHDRTRFVSLGWVQRTPAAAASTGYFDRRLLPHMYLWAVLLFVATTSMHVQVITRFFSGLPVVFWFAGHAVAAASLDPNRRWVQWAVVGYFVGYGLVGAVLFSNFFPPA